jgi:2-hydroxychromene-2-carboxylate isomerase
MKLHGTMRALIDKIPIEFWFDFASGYAYFTALEIDMRHWLSGTVEPCCGVPSR